MKTLNLNNFPDINYGHIFICLERNIEDKMLVFPQTYSRAEGAMRFCWFITGDEKTLFHGEIDKRNRLRESFLRASLAEFVSMEEALVRDLDNIGSFKSALKINDNSNPLLHILRELRNLEIHLTSSTLSAEQREFVWKPEGEERKIVKNVWSIDNLKASDFLQLKNAKNYDSSELKAAANRFLIEQKKWGVNELLLRGINSFCEEIVNKFGL